jgi:hypothetical protein
VGKRHHVEPRPLRASSELESVRLKQLFDLVLDRLTLSDALKEKLTALTAGEQLFLAQTMSAPPRSAAEREFYGQLLWANVRGRFTQTLSDSDLRLWKCPPPGVGSSPAHVRLLKSFDDFLLAQFRHFGPALFMSQGVLQRIFAWRKADPHWMKLLAAELELNSRAVCGDDGMHLPISQDLGTFKREAVKELRVLFSQIRTEFSPKKRAQALIADRIERAVKHQTQIFPILHRSLPQLRSFLQVAPEDLVLGIANGRTQAPSFIDAWVASATGYSVQRARQAMSKSRS